MSPQEQLKELLDKMVVPEMRRELTKTNLRWLWKNLHFLNSMHPEFEKADLLIRELMKG